MAMVVAQFSLRVHRWPCCVWTSEGLKRSLPFKEWLWEQKKLVYVLNDLSNSICEQVHTLFSIKSDWLWVHGVEVAATECVLQGWDCGVFSSWFSRKITCAECCIIPVWLLGHCHACRATVVLSWDANPCWRPSDISVCDDFNNNLYQVYLSGITWLALKFSNLYLYSMNTGLLLWKAQQRWDDRPALDEELGVWNY